MKFDNTLLNINGFISKAGQYAKSIVSEILQFKRNFLYFRLKNPSRLSRRALINIDYLIYSSHKTATQTVSNTLRMNNYKCIHCHSLTNETTQLERGTFSQYLEQYYMINKRKLNVITIFREPIERHISSFFQYHGDGVVRKKLVQDITDTIIYKYSVQELQERFIHELDSQTLVGREESIDEICKELNINIADLNYNIERQYGLVEMDYFRLFIFRFDILIYRNRLEYLFSQTTGRSITQKNANVSFSKWYRNTFAEFKASIKISHSTIRKIYDTKRNIINLLFPDEYDSLLAKALEKYG